ncbi:MULTISPECIES: NmrA/HSCARG family protein [Gordonia]|uniref:NmrA-like domain-containing protein n=3 Tax=Gordonia alkanivorans TaxID=84096 RepID=F9VW35_9ACTN|nr:MULTISPECIES: NmrA/HSCARG family protein [Gordonia]ETA07623.1 NmrA family transcriptional regulator [Gordonia alkanivorans CGMCC 6845]MDH3007018.1 NmrA/HSCARG family protein [Gordonia alkanivorans]MDH3013330.1 NmrA/HSCARG family protein [Gordonia alkanivorans]MDH3015105.1 NmrA/HSCARG family protein [Gordonia alkanivorans]MDH3040085.1 NmrA/HSCARG family protein [Gordonia alkanivorans]
MSDSSPIVVIGATGGQGGAVLDALLDAGFAVRALVRDAVSSKAAALADRGVELAVGDIVSGVGLTDAFTGAAGAFALTTPFESGVDAEVAQGTALIESATAAALPYLVFSSVASADRDTAVPHFDSKFEVERMLAATDIPHTIVGPAYFYDNLLAGSDALAAGVMPIAMPADQPLQQLSRRDLGRFVATLFRNPGAYTGERIDIASDQPTPLEMAEIVGDALGTTVSAESYDPERIPSPDMSAMFTFLGERGYEVDIPELHRRFPDVGWQTFAEWAAEALRR